MQLSRCSFCRNEFDLVNVREWNPVDSFLHSWHPLCQLLLLQTGTGKHLCPPLPLDLCVVVSHCLFCSYTYVSKVLRDFSNVHLSFFLHTCSNTMSGDIMFSGCLLIRPSAPLSLTQYIRSTLRGFLPNWHKCLPGLSHELIRIWLLKIKITVTSPSLKALRLFHYVLHNIRSS